MAYKSLQLMKRELKTTVEGDSVLRDHRLIIPKTPQKEVTHLAHEGHQGRVKTTPLIREQVWFHRINRTVQQCIRSCIACQIYVLETMREPL